jgi:carbamoyl-phosphate synthase large subunit
MRSTGEVMASGADLATAFARAERAAGRALPSGGRVFLSVRDADKVAVVPVARALTGLGFALVATAGTARALSLAGIEVQAMEKGAAVVELVRSRGVDLVVNTPQGRNARRDGYAIREAALVAGVPCITTLAVARAAADAIANARPEEPLSLQERQAALEPREVLSAAS